MKKIILTFTILFIFISKTDAKSTEQELRELNDTVNQMEEKLENLEKTRLDKMYPVGSIYITTVYSSASDVKNAIGGTWEVYGSGRTLFSVNTNDSNFNTVNKTGGVSSVTLSTSNLPSHTHSIPTLTGTAASAGAHTHKLTFNGGSWTGFPYSKTAGYYINYFGGDKEVGGTTNDAIRTTIANAGAHTHNVTVNSGTSAKATGSNGSATSFTNLNPYITVYMYKRVG